MRSSLPLLRTQRAPCGHASSLEIQLNEQFDQALFQQYDWLRQYGLDFDTVFVSGLYARHGQYVFMVCRECRQGSSTALAGSEV